MHQAGPFNPAFDAERFGLKDLKSISYNFEAPRLVENAIRQGEALVAKGGALSAETRIHTGRSPNDKFTVRDGVTDKTVSWEQRRRKRSIRCMATCSPMPRACSFTRLCGGSWSAPTDGSSLYLVH